MAMTKQCKSETLAVIHGKAQGPADAEVMPKKRTMRELDEMRLVPVKKMAPTEIRRLRLREHVSQTVFACHLNVPASLVSQWERGVKRPSGASMKLLNLVEKNGLSAVA